MNCRPLNNHNCRPLNNHVEMLRLFIYNVYTVNPAHVITRGSRYSQTCIKRSPLGQRTNDLISHMKFSMTGQEKGDLLIQVAA
jgi:hypothetical protein